jgi:hypothetical protein
MLSLLGRTALTGISAAILIPAAAASANTFCVGVPGCAGTPEPTLQAAIDAAGTLSGGGNRIELGSGTWIGAAKAGPQPQGLEIVGAGTGLTFVTSNVAGHPALWLTGAGESVSGLTARITAQSGALPVGLRLEQGARADGIRATADPGGAGGAAVRIDAGGKLSHSSVQGQDALGVLVSGNLAGDDTTISDSDIYGVSPVTVFSPGTTTVDRDRLTVTHDDHHGVIGVEGTTIVRDSLVDLRDVAGGIGLAASAVTVANATVDARRVTVLGAGPQSVGAKIESDVANGSASVSVADSLLRDVGIRVLRTTAGAANASLDHVDVWPAAADQVNGLVVADTASLYADPQLGADLVPQPGSPLIDRAAPLTGADGTTDLAGAARALDGDGDCTATPDIGAFEAPAATCSASPTPQPVVAPSPKDTSAPVITRLRFARRHGRVVAVRFRLSEAAAITLRVSRCTAKGCARTAKAIVIKRRAATGATTVKLAHRLRRGPYAIRVTAVDGAGNRAVKTVRRADA